MANWSRSGISPHGGGLPTAVLLRDTPDGSVEEKYISPYCWEAVSITYSLFSHTEYARAAGDFYLAEIAGNFPLAGIVGIRRLVKGGPEKGPARRIIFCF